MKARIRAFLRSARHVFLTLLSIAMLLVVLSAVLQSNLLYAIGSFSSVVLFFLAWAGSDIYELGRQPR